MQVSASHVSVSHDGQLAIAQVLLETSEGQPRVNRPGFAD